jgi:hypothetical protein
MDETASTNGGSAPITSASFERALKKFTENLTAKQRREFSSCTLEHVHHTISAIQRERGSQKNMRNMTRIESFLEAMDQLGKVVEVFLNSTPYLGYIWV